MIKIIHGDCRQVLTDLNIPVDDAIFVSDPPFNVGYKYHSYKDKLSQTEYDKLLIEVFAKRPHVLIHYPEALYKHAINIQTAPIRLVRWIYNTNLPRQHRDIAFFDVTPDFKQVGQDYKNPQDKRVAKLIAQGRKAKLYDFWEITQVKNNSKEKTEHPCQMPIEVMKRIIGLLPKNKLIVDPFGGSGTTAIACAMLGVDCISIELDAKYIAITQNRLAQLA